ncbi:hypothetical protein BHE74_00057110 [Ensete ventricosum]|nr:hypothetical protein BHE74_00057110 [Ensete ventricosum]RZS00735.1 hypothetical protein BHM03_00030489 [Ensete ventricosum]
MHPTKPAWEKKRCFLLLADRRRFFPRSAKKPAGEDRDWKSSVGSPGMLLDDLLVAEDLAAAETTSAASHAAAAAAAANVQVGRSPGGYIFSNERSRQTIPEAVPDGAVVLGTPVAPPVNGDTRLGNGVEYLVEASAAEAEAISAALAAAKARQVNGQIGQLPDQDHDLEDTPDEKQVSNLSKASDPSLPNNVTPAGVRLHHRAVIANLLKPRGWKPPVRRQFFLDCNEIADLCDSAERIFTSEPSVLQIKAPVKIFGDLHGQFGDLMRLFDEYGAPSTAGDIS